MESGIRGKYGVERICQRRRPESKLRTAVELKENLREIADLKKREIDLGFWSEVRGRRYLYLSPFSANH